MAQNWLQAERSKEAKYLANDTGFGSLGKFRYRYLTIIPRARMGSEAIAHEAEAEWAIESADMRVRGLIVLVKSN